MLPDNIVIHYRHGMLETVSPGEIALVESIMMDLLQEILTETVDTGLQNDEDQVAQDHRLQPQCDEAVSGAYPL